MYLRSYLDFAEDDFDSFVYPYNRGRITNTVGPLAQNICERYMKHIIQEFFFPNDRQSKRKMGEMLREHDLGRLRGFLSHYLGVDFSKETGFAMDDIDGFYINARYPGTNCVVLSKDDMDECYYAVCHCRRKVLDIIKLLEEKEREKVEDVDALVQEAAERADEGKQGTVGVGDGKELGGPDVEKE